MRVVPAAAVTYYLCIFSAAAVGAAAVGAAAVGAACCCFCWVVVYVATPATLSVVAAARGTTKYFAPAVDAAPSTDVPP